MAGLLPTVILAGDPHLHSTFSDGKMEPADLLALGASRGLDFVALADHNTVAGSMAARDLQVNGTPGPRAFLAQELSTEERLHLLLLGLDKTFEPTRFAGLPRLLERVCGEGGAVVLAHPWTIQDRPRAMGIVGRLIADGLIHGIELASAALFYEEFGRWRQTLQWYEEFCAPAGLAALGCSDWHDHGQGFSPGLGRTLFLGASADDLEFTSAVRAGETIACLSPPILKEHGLAARVKREIEGLWFEPWDGLIARPEVLARFRGELGKLTAGIEASGSPERAMARGLYAGGCYSVAARLIGG